MMTRRLFAVVTTILIVVGSPAARADAREAPQQTGTLDLLFEQGKRMFDAFQYDQAVPLLDQLIAAIVAGGTTDRSDLLVQAYEMRARARFANGNTTGAEQDFAALLAVRPDYRLGAGISPRVVGIFDGVRSLTIGRLIVSSTPPGEIQIDERPYMVPGEPVAIDLVAGTHRLTVNRQGFGPLDQQVTITAGAETEVSLALERVSATLSVVTIPADVEVFLDGQSRGRTPAGPTTIGPSAAFVLTDVPLGQHRIELRRECYAELSLPMNVTQDVETQPLELQRAVATVRLEGRAADAVVFVDGVAQGPLSERSTLTICEGQRVIEVRGSAGRFVDRRDWRRGASETLRAELRSGFPIVAANGSAAMPSDQLRTAVAQALAAAPAILVYAPVQAELDAALQKNNAPAAWLGGAAAGGSPSLPREAVRDLGQRIAADLGAQGLAAVTVGNEPFQAEVLLLAAGSGDPDRLLVNTADPASQRRVADAIGAPLPPVVRPSLDLSVVDVAGVTGAVVVRAGATASAAGYAAGDTIVGIGGTPVVSVADLRKAEAALSASTPVAVDVKNAAGQTRSVQSTASMVLDTIPLRDPALLYNRALLELRQRAQTAASPSDKAATNLNLAVVHLRLGNWDDALAALGQVQLPDGPGVSAGTVQYLRGLCLESAGRVSEARTAYAAAAEATEARISSEGPLVAPLARAKIGSLR